MVGGTNAVIGSGGGSDFIAYIQISTDANAQISAVNLHGDAYSGTADSNGSLTLTVTNPGTYTVSETGGGTVSAQVIDYGAAYSVSVYAFSGAIIENGTRMVNFESVLVSGSDIPQVTETTYNGEFVLQIIEPTGSNAIYRTANVVDISDYYYLRIRACKLTTNAIYVYFYDEQGNSYATGSIPSSMTSRDLYFETYGLDTSKKYKIGFGLNNGDTIVVSEMKFGN